MQETSAERKLKRAKINLMRNPKFALLSGVLMIGKTEIVERTVIPTAATNGRDEKYSRDFVMQLKDPELAFVIAHEAAHKMYRHLSTWKKLYDEDADLANQACDYVINIMLQDLDPQGEVIRMPRDKNGNLMGLLNAKYRHMSSKQVFDILKQEKQQQRQQQRQQQGQQQCGDTKSGGGGGSSKSGGDQGFDHHDWEAAEQLTVDEKNELTKQVDQAIREGLAAQKKVGTGAGGLGRELQDLLNPKINWREVLRDFVKSVSNNKDTSSWRRVNRRYLSADVYMPSLISECLGHIVVGVDTSGSIDATALTEFLSEVKGIADEVKPNKVDLLYWDTEVAAHEEYDVGTVESLMTSTKPRGGGGTAPMCVSEYMKNKGLTPECIVMLTDGHVPNWGRDWSAPILWCVVGNRNATADTGKTVHIEN